MIDKKSDWNKSEHESYGDNEDLQRLPRRYDGGRGGGPAGSHFNGGSGSAQMNKGLGKFDDGLMS